MKRKTIIMIAILAACTVAIYAAVTGAAAKPTLSFEGQDAVCRFSLSDAGKALRVTLELRCEGVTVGSWTEEGQGYVLVTGSCPARKSKEYELSARGTIDGEPFPTVIVTKTSPSNLPPASSDPMSRDWDKISVVAQSLLSMNREDCRKVLDAMGLEIPEGIAKDEDTANNAIYVILNSASQGHWGAYDYTQMAELQERILDCLELESSLLGDVPAVSLPELSAGDQAIYERFLAGQKLDNNNMSSSGTARMRAMNIPAEDLKEASTYLLTRMCAEHRLIPIDMLAFSTPAGGFYAAVDAFDALSVLLQRPDKDTWADFYLEHPSLYEGKAGVSTLMRFIKEPPLDHRRAALLDLPRLRELDFTQPNPYYLDAVGLDADIVEYAIPGARPYVNEGSLYFARPRFLHPYFADLTVEGSANWTLGPSSVTPYSAISFSWTQQSPHIVSGAITGPGVECIVDLVNRKVIEKTVDPWGDTDFVFTLTDEELVEIGRQLASIMVAAQEHYDFERWMSEPAASGGE